MKKQKRPHLPRDLCWKSDSLHIWFTWRDSRRKQHQQSTGTDDPATAFGFPQQFLEKSKEEVEEIKAQSAEIGKWPLKRVAVEYFNWKMANNSAATVAREKRIFKPVEPFFAFDFRVNAITLAHLREYQKQRRKHISPTMRQPVTGRTVNYELFLLRCVMTYAGAGIREIKQRAGKVASKDQIKILITTALANQY